MCGIAGFAWSNKCNLTFRQKERLIYLAAMGADKRGGQSYGFLGVTKASHFVHKGLGPLVAADFRRLVASQMGFLHSRYATQGDVSIQNSHPFEYDNIIGAHNGVVFNSKKLDEMHGKKEVDSEHIFEALAKGRDVDNFRAYGIIEYFDKEQPDSIFLSDIGKGDITVFQIKDDCKKFTQGYIWTSNRTDGELALTSAGITEFDAFGLVKGEIYRFDRGSEDFFTEKKKKLEVKANSPKKKNYQTTVYNGSSTSSSTGNSKPYHHQSNPNGYWRKNGREIPLSAPAQELLEEWHNHHPDSDIGRSSSDSDKREEDSLMAERGTFLG